MKLVFSHYLSIMCIFATLIIFINYPIVSSTAQIITTPKIIPNNDVFRVSIILFGVDDKTGNVLSFIKANNSTSGKFFNASKENLVDHDGIIETVLSLPNETVSAGANFTACNIVLKDLTMSCKWGLNMLGRTEVVQIVLPTFKHKGD